MLHRKPSAFFILLAAAAMACLAACGERAGSAVPASIRPVAGASYELVTVLRPESVDKFFTRARALYDACAATAQLMELPVKPFLVPPDDFVASRKTMISDGKTFMEKEVAYRVDTSKFSPEQGCQTALASSWTTHLVRDGKQQAAGTDPEGKYAVGETIPMQAVELDPAKVAGYTVPMTVRGVALKCREGANGAADTSSASGSCIIDPAAGKLASASGEPLVAHFRMTNRSLYNTVMVLEPVFLRVGEPVDPKVFTLAQ